MRVDKPSFSGLAALAGALSFAVMFEVLATGFSFTSAMKSGNVFPYTMVFMSIATVFLMPFAALVGFFLCGNIWLDRVFSRRGAWYGVLIFLAAFAALAALVLFSAHPDELHSFLFKRGFGLPTLCFFLLVILGGFCFGGFFGGTTQSDASDEPAPSSSREPETEISQSTRVSPTKQRDTKMPPRSFSFYKGLLWMLVFSVLFALFIWFRHASGDSLWGNFATIRHFAPFAIMGGFAFGGIDGLDWLVRLFSKSATDQAKSATVSDKEPSAVQALIYALAWAFGFALGYFVLCLLVGGLLSLFMSSPNPFITASSFGFAGASGAGTVGVFYGLFNFLAPAQS